MQEVLTASSPLVPVQAQALVRTVAHEEASRLPEPIWLWRRVLIYAVCIVASFVLAFTVHRVLQLAQISIPAGQLALLELYTRIIKWSFWTLWGALTLYGVGASVTDIASLVASFKTTRKETVTQAVSGDAQNAATASTTSTPDPGRSQSSRGSSPASDVATAGPAASTPAKPAATTRGPPPGFFPS